ncbi:uncharacterized protein LOC129950728 [Eupeodes corollae]|uniref:uncharacterized protein LOC129950728 n=1 Tax=Eupeodes corollae TaxID=290404 RepID=UPI002492A926|nr:uncharacterized protein LOC129950728 [Eupeodes corollae]
MNKQNLKPNSRGEYLLSLVGIKLQKDMDSNGTKASSQIPSLIAEADLQFDEEAPTTSGVQASSAFVQNDSEDSCSSSSVDFSSYDSQKDPEYCTSQTSESDGGEKSLSVSSSNLPVMESPKAKEKTRKRRANPDNWKRNQTKKLRNTVKKMSGAIFAGGERYQLREQTQEEELVVGVFLGTKKT